MKNNTDPFEIASDSRGLPFLALETPEGISARPWHDLKNILMNPDGTELTLEFVTVSVKISGTGLGTLADLACAARIKRLRVGDSSDVKIRSLRIVGEELE